MTRVQMMHFHHFFKNLALAYDKKSRKSHKAKNFRRIREMMPAAHYSGKNVWLLKPAGFNRGTGIHVFDNLQTLETLVTDYKKLANNEKL
jgi:hypothetical protein